MIAIGNDNNITLKIGTETVTAAYLGTELVYPTTPPIPPVVDYSTMYFTVEAIESGNFKIDNTPSGFTYQYSRNEGLGWTTFDSSTSVNIPAGDTIIVRGSNQSDGTTGIGNCTSTGKFNVYGNVMSLIYGDNFIGQTTILPHQLAGLFSYSPNLVSAQNLYLPVTNIPVYGYQAMFFGCTSLTTAPVLPATTLGDYAYQYMFMNCASLNSITCLATDISAEGCTDYWVNGVAATGTFTKDSSMSSWTTGNSGIPSGWTVQDY